MASPLGVVLSKPRVGRKDLSFHPHPVVSIQDFCRLAWFPFLLYTANTALNFHVVPVAVMQCHRMSDPLPPRR